MEVQFNLSVSKKHSEADVEAVTELQQQNEQLAASMDEKAPFPLEELPTVHGETTTSHVPKSEQDQGILKTCERC